jgi:hypothetical protein
MGGAALASILHVAATHRHHIVVVPSLLSNCHCPITVLESLPSSSSTLSPSAAAAASLLSLLPSPSLSHPSPSLPPLSTLLRQRRFVIVVEMGGGKFPWYLSYVFLRRIYFHKKRINKKWRTPSERARQDLLSGA